jgi:hypothetical protein
VALFHRVVLVNIAAVSCLAAVAAYGFAVSGNGDGTVAVPVPDPLTSSYCRALHEALPQRVGGLPRHDLKPESDLTAGWGDPAIVLRCGVPRPAVDDDPEADGVDVDEVGWSVEHVENGALRLTTTYRKAYVEVTLPEKYAGDVGPLTDLAGAVQRTVPSTV